MIEALSGQNILVTGATGFLGKVILEKLLRSVPNLGLVYLLIRPKRDKTAAQRLNALISSRIFNRLKSERKDFEEFAISRLRVINGDVAAENCGISNSDIATIQENVSVFIHSAATIDFTAPLSDSLNLNVLGSLRLFAIAKKCRSLVAFTHISTAYVNCNLRGTIDEVLYPLDFNAEDMLRELLNTDPAELDKNEQQIMMGYPNSYTFTKSLTEHLLAERRDGAPLLIFRPSIIGAAYKEPTPGWLDTVSAASALYVTAGMGIMKFMLATRPDRVGDQVPVDFVSNALIAATADIANSNRLNIIHVGTSKNKPLTWEYVKKTILPYLLRRPPKRTFSKPSFMFVTSDAVYNSLYFFQYRVPIAAYNLYARFLGDDDELRQAQLWASFEKRIRKMVGNFNYFVNHEWIFDTKNTYEVFNNLTEEEKLEFNFDIAKIDWEEYLLAFCYGMKLNILREEDTIYPLEDRNCPMYLRRDLGADFWWAWSGGDGVNETYMVNKPEKMKGSVFNSQRVQKAIMSEVQANEGVSVKQVEAHAREILDMMAGAVNMRVLRTQGYIFRKFYRYYYQGIFVDEFGIRRVAEAAKTGPIILVPTHRSYLDFLLTSFVFYDHDLPVPRIASGDDFLNMFAVSWLFRQSGAFFMRRSFGNDSVYRSIFTEYVQQVLGFGHPLEFFIEGTRSRTGKTLPPKLGVLSIIVDAFLQGGIENISLCPITMNYERLVEEESHGRELTGETKEKPTTTALIKTTASKLRHLNFGRVNVQFAEPISLEKFIAEKKEEGRQADASFDGSKGKGLWSIIESLGHEVVESFHREMVIMSTTMVSALALVHRDGIGTDVLADKIGWLREQIVMRGGRVDPFEGTNQDILDHAIPLLDKLVVIKRNILEPNFSGTFGQIQQLAMYRNMLVHIFQRESMVAICLNALLRQGGSVTVDQLRESHDALSDAFKSEFVDRSRKEMFPDTLKRMESYGLIKVGRHVRILDSDNGEMWTFLAELLYPFVDSYWVAAVTLLSMLGKATGMIERMLVERMQWFAEKHYRRGVLKYSESGGKNALRNAIKLFTKEKVIFLNESESLELTPEFQNDKEKLMKVVEKFAFYRRSPDDDNDFPLLARM